MIKSEGKKKVVRRKAKVVSFARMSKVLWKPLKNVAKPNLVGFDKSGSAMWKFPA